ncbi:MAG: hypothetical protein D6757_06635 [Alphaproteobacteria bacterium]|nr:MAG: hypothetical protein D6757_06635 [Alphaproteobacteria bacterium]
MAKAIFLSDELSATFVARPPEDDVEDDVEDEVEDRVEDEVEDRVEDEVEDRVEDKVEDRVEDKVEDRVEDKVEDRVEDKVESEVEHGVERDVEDDVEDRVDGDVADDFDAGSREDDAKADRRAGRGEDDATHGRHDRKSDRDAYDDEKKEERDRRRGHASHGEREAAHDHHEFAVMRTIEGRRELAIADELLILVPRTMAAPLRARIAADRAVAAVSDTELRLLDRTLLRVRSRTGASIADLRRRLAARLPEGGQIDLNHVYRPQQMRASGKGVADRAAATGSPDAGLPPAAFAPMLGLPQRGLRFAGVPIGIVDSAAQRSHPCLQGRSFAERHFIPDGKQVSHDHATMMLSILLARPECGIRGLFEEADVSLAAVFFDTPDYGPLTTAEALVSAIDWLVRRKVRVMVLALAGPANRLLESAVRAAAERGIVLIAAAGNGGPQAPPAYPAAWPETLAITALDRQGRVYAHAGRGPHIDFSAPGVGVRVARTGDGSQLRPASGTSLACAFAGAAIAWWLSEEEPDMSLPGANNMPDVKLRGRLAPLIVRLRSAALDLPPAGRDPDSGHGLLRLPALPASGP